ncbi:MAG TPA: hypothetical protein VGK73_03570, partial [Polyangiaceae bacterium]
VGEAVGAGEAFSPEARAREENLGPVTSLATDVLAGVGTGMAGAAADVAAAKGEAERSGMGPLGQAATTLLAAAPIVGPSSAARFVRELGGGTADDAMKQLRSSLDEAAIATPPAGLSDRPPSLLGDSAPVDRPTLPAAQVQTVPARIESVKQNQEGLLWYEKHMRQADPASGDAERFMQGLEDYEPTP